MKFGIDTFVTDQGMDPVTLARAIEVRGLDSLLVTEHSHIPVRRESPWSGGDDLPERYLRTYDPMVTLGAAAAVTSRLLLGTAIALGAQRDIIQFAKEVATLDQIAQGRVVLGVGVGWNREEARNHGIRPEERGRILDEKLAALREIWTQDQAEFHGKYVNFDPIFMWPKPVQRPGPPIYVGGESPAALRRLVAYGDGWLPRVRTAPEEVRRTLGRLRDQGKEARVIACGLGVDRAQVETYLAAEVDHVTFTLPTGPAADTLSALDEITALVESLR